jgi:hypothetical protein
MVGREQLPERTADAIALQQQLLAQHELLQTRLQDLSQAAADDVRMLARMCQLQNKMEAVGEPAYRYLCLHWFLFSLIIVF